MMVAATVPGQLAMASQRTSELPATRQRAAAPPKVAGLPLAAEVASGLVARALLDKYIKEHVVEAESTLTAIATAVPATASLNLSESETQPTTPQ